MKKTKIKVIRIKLDTLEFDINHQVAYIESKGFQVINISVLHQSVDSHGNVQVVITYQTPPLQRK